MKKGQELTGLVKEVVFPNKGIVETEEGDVIVKNALPGDKVLLRINKLRRDKPEAALLQVLEKSPKALEKQCPHFGICGGCTYLTMDYHDECSLKDSQIKKMLDRAIPYEYQWDGIKESTVFSGYRNKMEFSFGDEYKDGPLSLGNA